MSELSIMQDRIHSILQDKEKTAAVEADFIHTFKEIGTGEASAKVLAKKVIEELRNSTDLAATEKKIFNSMSNIELPNGKKLIQEIDNALSDRAETIFGQIKKHLEDVTGKIIDFGAGDGQVTQLIKDRLNKDISGVDVRNYPAPNVTVDISLFDGRQVKADPHAFETCVITNVLHHDPDNKEIVKELDRIVARKIVMIETVPDGKNAEEEKKDMDRTFMNDYFYNRLLHSANIPVPGTYERTEDWAKRFEKETSFKCTSTEELGYDVKAIRDKHVLYVFER